MSVLVSFFIPHFLLRNMSGNAQESSGVTATRGEVMESASSSCFPLVFAHSNTLSHRHAAVYELSRLLNTGLDRETLAILMALLQKGVNPEALASVVKDLRRDAAATAERSVTGKQPLATADPQVSQVRARSCLWGVSAARERVKERRETEADGLVCGCLLSEETAAVRAVRANAHSESPSIKCFASFSTTCRVRPCLLAYLSASVYTLVRPYFLDTRYISAARMRMCTKPTAASSENVTIGRSTGFINRSVRPTT